MSRRPIATLVPSLALGAWLALGIAACSGGAEATADSVNPAATATPAGDSGARSAPAADTGMQPTSGLLDPNTATREQLAAVPGMTPQAADALVAGRPYADMVAVDRALAGTIADTAARKRVYAQVWKPIDLNKASDAEILLIPGIGRRMLGEFKEYRPYNDIARFRREMGKYVDEGEVARLERYVQVR